MYLRDRLANVTLIVSALAAWAAVGLLFTTYSPFDAAGHGDAPVQLAGALLLGLAVALTLWPLFWLTAFARRRRIAHRGDWIRAARRGLIAGFVVVLLVVIRAFGAFSLPLAAFVVAMAVFVELSLTIRR
jgi:amino acid transporter